MKEVDEVEEEEEEEENRVARDTGATLLKGRQDAISNLQASAQEPILSSVSLQHPPGSNLLGGEVRWNGIRKVV